jgi:hypothetical protein
LIFAEKNFFLSFTFQLKEIMSTNANRIQAEGVIKNIIREIVQECASRGEGLFSTINSSAIFIMNI